LALSSAVSRMFRGHVTKVASLYAQRQVYDNRFLFQHNRCASLLQSTRSVPMGTCDQWRHEAVHSQITLYHKIPPSIRHYLGYILFHFLHFFHSRYESFTFRVLPVVVPLCLAGLHIPDRDKLNRSSICRTTREMRICGCYLFSSSRKCTEIPKKRWKDHQVTPVCRPRPLQILHLHCPW